MKLRKTLNAEFFPNNINILQGVMYIEKDPNSKLALINEYHLSLF